MGDRRPWCRRPHGGTPGRSGRLAAFAVPKMGYSARVLPRGAPVLRTVVDVTTYESDIRISVETDGHGLNGSVAPRSLPRPPAAGSVTSGSC